MLSAAAVAAVHRRARVLRHAYAAGLGHFLGTVIHHGRGHGCTLALAEITIALAVVFESFR